MTVTALGSPVTAEAFVIASEPAPTPAAGCRTALRGGAEDRPEPAYLYSMRRWRQPAERWRIFGDPAARRVQCRTTFRDRLRPPAPGTPLLGVWTGRVSSARACQITMCGRRAGRAGARATVGAAGGPSLA